MLGGMQALLGDLEAIANADLMFRLAARSWTTELALCDESGGHLVKIEDGNISGVQPCALGAPCDVSISAPRDEWRRLLERVPRPFYQDLWGAWTRHGFEIEGDLASLYPYYPALQRMLELLRTDG